jgi:hypothetical protein
MACALLVFLALPSAAADFTGAGGTIVIEHIGESEIFPGQTITVLGSSNVSPNLIIKILGPGLPDEGVSPLNFKGTPGEGVTVPVDNNMRWSFTWYTSAVKDSFPYTARYTIRAMDALFPNIYADFGIFIQKPDMSVTITPQTIPRNEYVSIKGHVAKTTDTVKVDVVRIPELPDQPSRKTYQVGVDRASNFELGTHLDLVPGPYEIIVTNPADNSIVWTSLTITSGTAVNVSPSATATQAVNATAPATTVTTGIATTTMTTVPTTPQQTTAPPTLAVTTSPAPQATGTGTPPLFYPAVAGVIVFVLGFAAGTLWSRGRRPPERA